MFGIRVDCMLAGNDTDFGTSTMADKEGRRHYLIC